MTKSNGKRGTLYDQVLDYARREIEEASAKIDELRRTLRLLEARVEAAKAVYETVAARLNLEDELEDDADLREIAYPDTTPQAPEPPEEEDEDSKDQDGFSMELIRRHLERQSGQEEEAPARKPAPQAARSETMPGFPELSEAERRLIEEHMRSRAEAERKG